MEITFAQSIDADASDEEWYSLIFDEQKVEWLIKHRWDIYKIGRSSDIGEKLYTLIEVQQSLPDVYKKVVELLKIRIFDKPPNLNGIRRIDAAKY